MDVIDLKGFGRSLAEAGLMDKSFASMSAQEVHEVARLLRAFTKKQCVLCEQWQPVEGAPWWVGKCRVSGQDVNNKSFCGLDVDSVPF